MTSNLAPATGGQLADQLTDALTAPEATVAAALSLPLVLRAHAASTRHGLDQVRRFLTTCPATAIGSAQATGQAPTLYLSAPLAAWGGYVPLLRRRRALSPLSHLDVHPAGDKVRSGQPGDVNATSWEVTLHPSVAATGMPCAADDATLEAFMSLLAGLGAERARAPMTSGTLTHIPVRLPDPAMARHVAAFPAVRRVAPVARVTFR